MRTPRNHVFEARNQAPDPQKFGVTGSQVCYTEQPRIQEESLAETRDFSGLAAGAAAGVRGDAATRLGAAKNGEEAATEDPYGWVKRVGTLISIPLLLGLAPVVGGIIGWALDRGFGTRPIFTILGLSAGFAAGIRETWLLIRRASEENHRKF